MQGGNPQAQYLFGILCEKGEVVPKNLNNAFQLYVSAANQNHGPATLAAARLLNGVTTDKSAPIKAWAFASLAVERGEKDAEKLVKEISGKLDEKQRTEAAKQLEDMKSGKAPKKDEPKKDPVKKDPPKATTTKPADKPKIK